MDKKAFWRDDVSSYIAAINEQSSIQQLHQRVVPHYVIQAQHHSHWPEYLVQAAQKN